MEILLHICCGPCSIYPVKHLRENNLTFKGYFFNPNIQPYMEMEKRIECLIDLNTLLPVPVDVIWDEDIYNLKTWFEAIGNNYDKKARCRLCYELRIAKTAQKAKLLGFSAFSTTLLYSRYQNHEDIKDISADISKRYGIDFYYHDFREGWEEGNEKSREMGIYRQPYCGCIFSEKERNEKRLKRLNEKLSGD